MDKHRQARPLMTEAHEDYLEAIVMLGGTDKRSVRPVDVANQMGVSKASVNKAVSRLREEGMLDQPYYGDITLTTAGYEYGSKVWERHRMLRLFLNKALGIDEETADAEACLIEHDISDASFEKWIAYIKKLGLE